MSRTVKTCFVIIWSSAFHSHVFVQQHTHPTYHALRSLDQQMFMCYSQPGTPTLPSPAEIGVICAAPAVEGAWWRAQVISFYKESESTRILPKVQAKEEAVMGTEDSGCSTCQSEDGISKEDLVISTDLSSAVHNSKEDLIQISGIMTSEEKGDRHQESSNSAVLEETVLSTEHATTSCVLAQVNGEALRNGSSEADADQSGGSDVNSMDSVDSCSALGTGNGQQSGSQASQTQSSELIVWEIEVPKHLVGRLILKQGRYVSFLKQSSGAKIYISTLPYTQEFQICHIEGAQQQVDKASALIGKKFKDLDLTNLYAPPSLPLSLPSLPMTSWSCFLTANHSVSLLPRL
ncbi:hypothetical protein Q7C36_002587 [Tachysurus vachellii]|uniref:K Homology domain-containing protein n=1 Tax=Tachysurus vachellii TaxID=175792 RepID=A0AA88NUP3_TACVA|nr:hypothetical protein Q7C36_002587 [Tachysurus vachellii]